MNRGITKRETTVVIAGSVAFLLFQRMVVGLIPAQVLMVLIFNLLFFAHRQSRKLALALLPFVLFEICYDWMRLYPNYLVNAVDIRGVYETEKALFGIAAEGTTLIPSEYFMQHHHAVADVLAGLFYLCWVPGPIALALWLFVKGERGWCVHMTWAFLFVNLLGFAGYYLHPTAPPWYAIGYGFEPDFSTPGNVAGLARFDALTGCPIFSSIYVNNANIFAAIPSLHAAYMLVATFYAVLSRRSWPLIAVCCIVTAGIWWTAVYTAHHYVIDVLLGIAVAGIGVAVFEWAVRHVGLLKSWMDGYIKYVE